MRRWLTGILLVVAAGDLVAVAQEATEAFGALLRQCIDEVDTRFRARPPIYVIVTKVDQLVGFEEFFDSLSTEEKDAVLGFPLWSPNQPATPLERLTAGFAEIMERLKERQLHRLQEEGDDRLRRPRRPRPRAPAGRRSSRRSAASGAGTACPAGAT